MGYSVTRFPGAVDENLLCSICSAVLEDPVLTPCGHSFCLLCLDTWLSRPGPASCPQCRGSVEVQQARPILSVRNLISSMPVHCEHRARGCKQVVKLEQLSNHLGVCGYLPVECAGCAGLVNRSELADHHTRCHAISCITSQDVDASSAMATSRFGSKLPTGGGCSSSSAHVTELACRVAMLELQLRRIKRDLEVAQDRNAKLEQELKKVKEELEEKRVELITRHHLIDFDPNYDYGYTAHSIATLACFIARFLFKKPTYVDCNRAFTAVKRCYDNYGCYGNEYGNDVHMLVATAYSSDWFSESQKTSFRGWLQSILKNQQYQQHTARSSSSGFFGRDR